MPHNDTNWLEGTIKHVKRTEQEILKDFEALGYEVVTNNDFNLIMNKRNIFILDITKVYKGGAYARYDTTKAKTALYISMQEHKLLNELFTIWGWV